jgi:hypothetical protein
MQESTSEAVGISDQWCRSDDTPDAFEEQTRYARPGQRRPYSDAMRITVG